MKVPLVSIIVPSRDSEKTIGKLLDSIFSMNYPKQKYEVIIVDSSIDKTQEIVKNYPVKLIKISRAKRRNIALACNRGIKFSKREFIAFVDSDCVVSKDWLKDLVVNFSNDRVACVGGKVTTTGNIYDTYAQNAYKSPMREVNKKYITDASNFHKGMWPIGANFMIRKEVMREVKCFDEKLEFYEEVDLFWRICKRGYKIVLVPNAKVEHSYKRGIFQMFRTYLRYGKGCGYFCKKYKISRFAKVRTILILGILIYYLSSIVLFFPFFKKWLPIYFFILPLAPYFYLSLYYFSKLKEPRDVILFPFFDFVFCGVAYIIGFISSFIELPKE